MTDTFKDVRSVLTMLEWLILTGKCFEAFVRETVAPRGDLFFEVVTAPDKYLLLYYRRIDPSEPNMNFRTYSNWTGGQVIKEFPIIKLRNDGDQEPGTRIKVLGDQVEADQNQIMVDLGLFGISGANISSGQPSTEIDIRVVAPGSRFLIWANNESEQASDLIIQYKFAEVDRAFIGDPGD